MQLPTQQQFVEDCLSKYRWEPIPADQQWEAAHFPLPSCSGDGDTVVLWSADHTVQGLLQSVELDHRCFYYKANNKDLLNLQTYYPEYLELFQQLKSQFSSRNGKKSAATNKVNGTGLYDPKVQSAGGKKCAELKLGVCGRSAEQMTADGKKAAAVQHAQRWQCLVTSYISTPCGLSRYQKARGIDTKLRVKLNTQVLSS